MSDTIETIYWIVFAIPSILVASTVHEYAHAWAAYKLGDLTAKIEGRMSLNPLVHIDPIGAFLMIVARFGWSKPVPINEYNFRDPVRGTALTAAAGPISNFLMAILTSLIIRLLPVDVEAGIVGIFFYTFLTINLSLMVFNLLPIPPLDGHKIVRALLPGKLRYFWEDLGKYSIWILLILFLPFSPIGNLASTLISSVLQFFLNILV